MSRGAERIRTPAATAGRAHRLAWSLLCLASVATADPLRVIDIGAADAADVAALKRSAGEGWWLEMGRQLVLVGAAAAAPTSSPVLAGWDGVDPQRLLLRARGCSEHAEARGVLLAEGGRWELREVTAADAAALLRLPDAGWRPVTRNSTLARQYRLDAAAQPAAADPLVQQVVDRIDAARWFADLRTLSSWDRSIYGTTSLEAARDWIGGQFEALGLETTLQPFTMSAPGGGSIVRHNVIGVWPGGARADRLAIVGAHYDSRNASIGSTVNAPGAEDNASGCAGVIELARALLPSQPAQRIVFMCYAGEEQGLRGSLAHVQSLSGGGELERVDLVAIMDMIAFSASPELEALIESSAANSDYLARFGAAAASYVPELSVLTSTQPFGSDHVPYINAGLRAALTIENDWNVYPHYHRSTDVAANLGPHAQAMGGAILRTNAAVIAEAVGLMPVPFADGFESR